MPEFGHLFTTGQEYVEYIHRIPVSERKWHHEAYLWYHTNAKVILLALAICAMIYTALVYRGLVAAAARGSIKTRSGGIRKVVMSGGGADGSTNGESTTGPYTGPSFAQYFNPTTQPTTQPTTTTTNPTPAQLDEEKRAAKLQKKREKTAVKKALQGDRPNYLSEGAHKRLTAATEKMKDVGAKIKGAPKAFYKDLKSGKVGAQAKLMTQAAGAKIHDTVAQNASSVYTIIFSLFLFSGVALYFIPTIGMIGIGILTFYMFSNFVRSIITL